MTTSVPFSVEVAHLNGRALVAVMGEVDMETSPELGRVLADLGPTDIVVDLTACEFIDSSGIAVLLGASGVAHSLVLRSPRPIVRRTIEVVGVGDVLPIEDSDAMLSP